MINLRTMMAYTNTGAMRASMIGMPMLAAGVAGG